MNPRSQSANGPSRCTVHPAGAAAPGLPAFVARTFRSDRLIARLLVGLLALVLGPPGNALAQPNTDDWILNSAGFGAGGGRASDDFFVLETLFGLPVAGVLGDDEFRIDAGFWPATLAAGPAILAAPASVTVAIGDPAAFAVNAAGDPPLTYEWRLNGVTIPGATNAGYFIAGAQLTNGGLYTVVVSNPHGRAVSEPFKLGFALPRTIGENLFASRQPIATTNTVFVGDNTNGTREAAEPRHARKPGGRSVWYRWTAPDTGIATFETTGSSFDTLLAVYTGSSLQTLKPIAANDDVPGRFLASEVRFNTVQGAEYQIAIDGLGGAIGEFVLSWAIEVTPDTLPVVTSTPTSKSVPLGTDASLAVTAAGPGLSYQWFFEQTPIPGANLPTLAIPNFSVPAIGRYSVAITNSLGRGLRTDEAALEIGAQPSAVSFAKLPEAVGEANAPEDAPGGGGGLAPAGVADPPFQPAGAVAGGFDSVSVGVIDSHAFNNLSALPNPCAACGAVIGGAMQTYILQPLADGILTVDTTGSAIDTILYVYTNGPLSLICSRLVGCDDNGAPDGVHSLLSFPVRAGIRYLIGVDGVNGAKGSIQLNWRLCLPPAPFTIADGIFTLRTPANPLPYPDEPLYHWFRGDEPLGDTSEPQFAVGPPPIEATRFSVRYTTTKQGAIQQVTNHLGWVLTIVPVPAANTPPGFQQFALPGTTSTNLIVESARPEFVNCDGSWLWQPVPNSLITTQQTSVLITVPIDAPGRIHRVRPAPAGP